jgi:transcriptional regulator with XRE-family HTH domain
MTGTLADRMKDLREARRWTLREAAEKTGVSKSMLSKIERGTTSPTATILGRLAEGFGMSISQFVGGELRRGDVVLFPREDQPVFRVPTTGFERRSLSPVTHHGGAVDFCVNVLPPGQSSGTFPAHHAGVEEVLVVASGLLRLHLGDAMYELRAGDAVFYRAHVSHRFDNPSEREPVVFYIVINNAGSD